MPKFLRARILTWEQVRTRRLARNHLLKPVARTQLVPAVSDLCGVQAQVLTAAELAIGARVRAVTQQAIEDALWKTRGLVKPYGPRGTLHLLPADEVPLWTAALRALPLGRKEAWYAGSNLTGAQAQDLFEVLRDALEGCALTRAELADAVSVRLGQRVRETL